MIELLLREIGLKERFAARGADVLAEEPAHNSEIGRLCRPHHDTHPAAAPALDPNETANLGP
ncbi:MAG: hypothetical protein ACT4R6_06145, partial [Gemmatimonadaceae bacterium]